MTVRRHVGEVSAMDDEAFAAWRQRKMKDLIRAAPHGTRHGRRRHAQEVMRRYIKARRARSAEASEEA